MIKIKKQRKHGTFYKSFVLNLEYRINIDKPMGKHKGS